LIDVPEQGSERRWRVSPIVIDPPPKERIETIGNFGQRQLCAMSDAHFPDLCSHGLQCYEPPANQSLCRRAGQKDRTYCLGHDGARGWFKEPRLLPAVT